MSRGYFYYYFRFPLTWGMRPAYSPVLCMGLDAGRGCTAAVAEPVTGVAGIAGIRVMVGVDRDGKLMSAISGVHYLSIAN